MHNAHHLGIAATSYMLVYRWVAVACQCFCWSADDAVCQGCYSWLSSHGDCLLRLLCAANTAMMGLAPRLKYDMTGSTQSPCPSPLRFLNHGSAVQARPLPVLWYTTQAPSPSAVPTGLGHAASRHGPKVHCYLGHGGRSTPTAGTLNLPYLNSKVRRLASIS